MWLLVFVVCRYEVEGIPTLLLVSPAGKLICKDARARVEAEPEGYPWPKKAVEVCVACVFVVCVWGGRVAVVTVFVGMLVFFLFL